MWRALLQMLAHGRYGLDAMGRFLLVLGLCCQLLATIIRQGPLVLPLQIVGFALIIWQLSRMLSRRIPAREAEARRFALLRRNWQRRLQYLHPQYLRELRHYKFYTCPRCAARLRLPRGKGKVVITCNRCGHKIPGKS